MHCFTHYDYTMAAAATKCDEDDVSERRGIENDVSERRGIEKSSRLQIETDRRLAVALNEESVADAGHAEDLVPLKNTDASEQPDPCNVCGRDKEVSGHRVRACGCARTTHAACLSPWSATKPPTCAKCSQVFQYNTVAAALIAMGGGGGGRHPASSSSGSGGK